MNIINIFLTIAIFIIIMLIKKTDKKLNFIKHILYTIMCIMSINFLICFIFSICNVPITLYTILIARTIIIAIGITKIIYDKKIQIYEIKIKDVAFILIIICIAIPIILNSYGNLNKMSYIANDGGAHFKASKAYKNSISIFVENFEGFLPFIATNEGIIYRNLTEIIEEFNLYKVFLISDITIWITSVILYYFMFEFNEKQIKLKYIFVLISSIIFFLGYPLNNLLTGFHYLQAGVNFIMLSVILLKEQNLSDKSKTLYLLFINTAIIFTYNLFAPLVYSIEAIYIIKQNREKTNKIINLKSIIQIIVSFILPGILAILYFIVFRSNDALSTISGVKVEGYIYRNLYTTIILFIPFTLYYLVRKLKEKDNSYSLYFIIALILYTLIFLGLYLNDKISTYYYYKLYYLIWPFVIYASTEGIFLFCNKRNNSKNSRDSISNYIYFYNDN